MAKSPERRPVRAAVALSGASSLGTFLVAAIREIVLAARAHNAALADPSASDDDPRILHPRWGKITIDSVGGSSAGALCGGQLVKSLFQPGYLGAGRELDTPGTMTGDWIEYASFQHLAQKGVEPQHRNGIESPGWTLLSPNKLYDITAQALNNKDYRSETGYSATSPLPENGIVGVGITLTDLLGYHEYADFEADQVLGHPQFGAAEAKTIHFQSLEGRTVRDLGVRQHSEVRRLFIGTTPASKSTIEHFLARTRRRGKATGYTWSEAPAHLSALSVASASLPVALGPLAMTDAVEGYSDGIRRLYLDGGLLNNKPIAPALTLARWQDEVRILSQVEDDGTGFDHAAVAELLDYERVCFFLDAFPDQTRGAWRSPHPDRALIGASSTQMRAENVRERNARIDQALGVPSKGIELFLESLLSSVRAQDIRGVAQMNYRVAERRKFIRSLVGKLHHGSSSFQLTGLQQVHAYAAVSDATRDMDISHDERLALADVIDQADVFARMGGRRNVTVVPVFAPENLNEVLAGSSIFAVGGMLSRRARLHDAKTGQRVARYVLNVLRPDAEIKEEAVPPPDESDLPSDSEPLVTRLRLFAKAFVHGDGSGSPIVRRLVAMPFQFQSNPLINLLKSRMDTAIRGTHGDDAGSEESDEVQSMLEDASEPDEITEVGE